MNGGTWKLRDSYRTLEQGLIQGIRRWEWHGEQASWLTAHFLNAAADLAEQEVELFR